MYHLKFNVLKLNIEPTNIYIFHLDNVFRQGIDITAKIIYQLVIQRAYPLVEKQCKWTNYITYQIQMIIHEIITQYINSKENSEKITYLWMCVF
jgi:hypothetical protein